MFAVPPLVVRLLWIGASLYLAEQVHAHKAPSGWAYPPACCNGRQTGGDCQAIPSDDVSENRDGYSILIRPGDHFLATKPHRFFVPYGNELPSGDGDYHVCLHTTESDLNCFFAPKEDS